MDGYRGIVLLALTSVLAGCGSGALSGPTDTVLETTTTSQTTETRETTTTTPAMTTTTKRQYGWYLPAGPTSPQTNEDGIFQSLVGKNCGDAQEELDSTWASLQSPRNSPLYQAGVDLCRGNAASARSMFAKAAGLGLAVQQSGGTSKCDCALLKAVRSVLDQVHPDSVRCTFGTPPPWPTDDTSARDDPRTDVVEGTTTSTTTTTTTTTSTTTVTSTS